MTKSPTPSAPTDKQIIYRIAIFMGWELKTCDWERIVIDDGYLMCWAREVQTVNPKKNAYEFVCGDKAFNPLINWNDWREVEEKVMEDEELRRQYLWKLGVFSKHENPDTRKLMKADLPTRCRALLSALDSIKKND